MWEVNIIKPDKPKPPPVWGPYVPYVGGGEGLKYPRHNRRNAITGRSLFAYSPFNPWFENVNIQLPSRRKRGAALEGKSEFAWFPDHVQAIILLGTPCDIVLKRDPAGLFHSIAFAVE